MDETEEVKASSLANRGNFVDNYNEDDSSDMESEGSFVVGENIDCRDTVNKWLNAEIISQIQNLIKVHYTSWSKKFDEWIALPSDRVLKQWKRGRQIQVNNRIDVLHATGVWFEALVQKINGDLVFIHYVGYLPKYDECVDLKSERVAEVGTHSSGFGSAKIQKLKDQFQSKHSELIKAIQEKEQKFAKILESNRFTIYSVGIDGNCLFRAVSDQIYGVETFHQNIRRICVEYILLQKDFFEKYTMGGPNNFAKYIAKKRVSGVWGEDVEIQALSEIYDRPIDIYVYSDQPLRKFNEFRRNQALPISLSYHGQSHFNSLRKIGQDAYQTRWG